jgi:hypothetical protein
MPRQVASRVGHSPFSQSRGTGFAILFPADFREADSIMNDNAMSVKEAACRMRNAEQDDGRAVLFGELLQRVREVAHGIEQRVETVMADQSHDSSD